MATIGNADFITTAEAAELLELAPDTVKKYCQKGDIAGVKFGRSWLVPRSEVKRYRTERRSPGRPINDTM